MAHEKDMDVAKKAILKAAAACFEENGVKKSTLVAIAERAGVEVAQLKSIFKNKNLLALMVQRQDLERLKSDYIKNMPHASVEEMVKFIIRTRCEFVEKHSEQTLLFFRNAFLGRQPWTKAFEQLVWQLSIEFATLIENGVHKGTIKKETDINIAVRAITSFYLTGIVTIGLQAESFDATAVWGFIEPQVDMLFENITV